MAKPDQGSAASPPGHKPQSKTAKSNIVEIESNAALKASRMATLLSIEAGAREVTSLNALAIRAVNDPRPLGKFDQCFFLEKHANSFSVRAVTAQASINKNAPLIQMVEACAQKIALQKNCNEPMSVDLSSLKTEWTKEQKSYPFRELYWIPLHGFEKSSQPMGALLIARHTPWRDVDIIVLTRVADTYAHAWRALKLAKHRKPSTVRNRRFLYGAGLLAIIVAMFLPVPYTAIAPAQIIPSDPFIVSAPVDGVIESVHVNPNIAVSEGEPLFSYVDTSARNSAAVSANELLLAEARLANVKRSALIDNEGRRDLVISDAERTLAATRDSYARELLNNVHITASRDGVILYPDRNDLIGKPVITGEKIMEIADPSRVIAAIEVPPSDAASMHIGQPINVFLDVAPLRPIRGTLVRASFTPSMAENGILAYRGIVEFTDENGDIPRIGLRGSAKLNAGKTALWRWLFRKPIAVARRTFGV